MTAKNSVLVTGASGFIGRHVLKALSRDRWQIHALARHAVAAEAQGVTWHQGDLLRPGTASRLVGEIRPTALLHLAWNATPGKFWEAPDNLDWVGASLELYRAFATNGGRRAVVAGTCAEYDWSYDLLDEVSTPLRPVSLYGISKLALFQLLSAACRRDGLDFAWARVFFLYGPFEAEARLVPYVIRALLKGHPADCGAGHAERDFMHVEDVAKALIAVLESDYRGAVNVASGSCVPLRDVISNIGTVIGRPDLIRLGVRPPPPNEPPRMEASTTILRQQIGFHRTRSLAAGLADTVSWWRDRETTTQ